MNERAAADDGPDEAGFSLIEVLVALAVLLLLAAAAASGLGMSLRTSRSNEARVVAANLATRQIERVRGMDPAAIADVSYDFDVDGRTYTVDQTTEPDSVGGSGNACEGSSGPAAFTRIRVEVSWPDMGTTTPVRSETIRSLPVTGLAGGKGILTVGVHDRDNKPVKRMEVTLQPGNVVALTGKDGCAVFPGLAPGTSYSVSVDRSGWVDLAGRQLSTRGPLSVVAGEITKDAGFTYDRAAQVQVSLPSRSGYSPPANIGVSLGSPVFTGGARSFPQCATPGVCAVPNGAGSLRVSGLFPVAGGYTAWLGTCADARPTSLGASIDGPAGGSGAGSAAEGGSVSVTVIKDAMDSRSDDGRVWAYHPPDSGCPGGEIFYVGDYEKGDPALRVALPAGQWRIVAEDDYKKVPSDSEYRVVTVASGGSYAVQVWR